ncbi:MAG: PDZ domain-containing protein [Candidatus Eremiobacteraeota bacterium]|nr:PDZ domain-containing protein [Candidatus Eremiobacteraeota bacterium]
MRAVIARKRLKVYSVAALVVAALSFTPTPYSLILPGSAVNLNKIISVAGHPQPKAQYYLTDVTLQQHASPLLLLATVLPGARLVKAADLVPAGVNDRQFEDLMIEAMSESKSTAAEVAERAAGLPVRASNTRVVIRNFIPASKARDTLKIGDVIANVRGRSICTTVQVQNELAKVAPGATVPVSVWRHDSQVGLRVKTIGTSAGTRFGILLQPRFSQPKLPVAVRYNISNVSGSSGGLMFALDIYHALRPAKLKGFSAIAGTGTIACDGTVGPIEGAAQKVIAARKAGAQIFFVPTENYREILGTPSIRIVPVGTFAQAVTALRS